MYATLYITYEDYTTEIRTTDYDSIYDYLLDITNDHHFAEEVASWAENAPIGEEYDSDEYPVSRYPDRCG